MIRRGIPLLALFVTLTTLAFASSATKALPPTPQPSCSPGPADCGAWHTGNVTVSWSGGACGSVTITTDGAGQGGLHIVSARSDRAVEIFAVTLEPEGTNAAPTGPIVLASRQF